MRRRITVENLMVYLPYVSILYLFNNSTLHYIGVLAFAIIIGLSILIAINKFHYFRFSKSFPPFVLFSVLVFFRVFLDYSTDAVYKGLQMVFLLFLFTIYNQVTISEELYYKQVRNAKILCAILVIVYSVLFLMNRIESQKMFSNTISKFILPTSMFFLPLNTKKVKDYIKVFFFVIFTFIIGERGMTLSFVVVFFSYKFLNNKADKRNRNMIFYLLYFVLLCFPFIYVWASQQIWKTSIDRWALSSTGARVFSGRNILWNIIIQEIDNQGKWWTGLGFSNTLFAENAITRSAHNVNMYLFRDGGIMCVFAYFLFMRGVWSEINYQNIDDDRDLTEAYMLGLVTLMSFEVFLIGYNFSLSVYWWMTLSMYKNKKKEINNIR